MFFFVFVNNDINFVIKRTLCKQRSRVVFLTQQSLYDVFKPMPAQSLFNYIIQKFLFRCTLFCCFC